MLKFSQKKCLILRTIMFLFLLLSYSNQAIASRVDASKYGFNATDATAALNAAIASRADTVFVPYMGTDWIVTPIFPISNQTIIFQKDVNVVAKKGAFLGEQDCLFRIQKVSSIALIGYGATFRMQKADYMKPPYNMQNNSPDSPQWRHCIAVFESDGVKILGLTLKESGGDGIGIYWDPRNVMVKDVICDNNYRQGMSPCDVRNLTLENCIMKNTGGHAPSAGVDFETIFSYQYLQNIKMINCFIEKNVGDGISFYLPQLNNTTPPISAELRHCFLSGELTIDIIANGPTGTMSFEDCFFGNSPRSGFRCNKIADRLPMKFTNCQWQNCGAGAIKFSSAGSGNLQFINCTINEPDSQASILRAGAVANITGDIKVNGPYGALSDFGTGNNITAKITENKTKLPVVTNITPAKYSVFNWGNTIDVSAEAYDPDKGIASGAGITKVDFALWRGDVAVATISDVSSPFEGKFNKTTGYEQGIYLLRVTAYSQDGSNRVDVVPISLIGTPNSSGLTFTSSSNGIVPNNGFFGYKATVNNTTGAAVTFTFLKKPSWVMTNGDSAYGNAPATPSVDTLTILAMAGAIKETLKVVITVNSRILIEAESGNVTAPMQIKDDPNAFGGKCITTPAGTGNTISPRDTTKYSVNIPKAGTYYVWLRIFVPAINPSANWGTFVGFNKVITKPGIANINAGRYEWVMGSAAGFVLPSGANQFIIGHGNEQVQIDQIIISNSPIAQLPPTGINRPNMSIHQNIGGLKMKVSGNTINFLVNLERAGNFSLRTYNISGQKVWEQNLEKCSAGLNRITLDKSLIKNGVYMTEFSNNKVHSVVKYVVVE
jgi:hypothetical protein